MKVNLTERQLLYNKKLQEGKDKELAQFEINMIDSFQDNLKYDLKSMQKKIKHLENENFELRKKIARLRLT